MSTNRQPPPPTPSLHPTAFQRALRDRVNRDEGLRCALCALNCYRHRHAAADRHRCRKTARAYVTYARGAGFRGSVNAILDALAAGGGAKSEVGMRKLEVGAGQ